MYQEGQGVAKDPKEAIRWYRRAAEQGSEVAQIALDILEQKFCRESFKPNFQAGGAALKQKDYATALKPFRLGPGGPGSGPGR